MGFIRRAFEFIVRPSHSRTLGLVLMLVLVAAVSLTVYVAQQQQETRQRASGNDDAYAVCFKNITDTYNTCQAACNSAQSINDTPQECIERNCVPAYQSGNIYCVSILSATPTPTPTPSAEAGKPYTIGLIGDKCPEGTKYADSVIAYLSGSICCAFETPVFCSMDDYRCVASKSECKTSVNVKFSPTNTPTPSQTACQIAGGSCVGPFETCASPSVITRWVSCASDSSEFCCINPASINCQGDNSKCPTGYTCDSFDGYCAPKQIAIVIPTSIPTPTPVPPCGGLAQACCGGSNCNAPLTCVFGACENPPPIPTQVSTSSTCINKADVDSLKKLYIQGGSTVTLQDVNIKARQYIQNPCK